MFDYYNQSRQYVGLMPTQLLGTQKVIVPNHIVRYCLRQGGGRVCEAGMTMVCHIDVFLIDGTQIVKDNGVSKLLVGRKRLIKGLQIGLLGVKENQKIRLVISPQYGYKDDETIKLVPPNSKLIFQIDVIDLAKQTFEQMNDYELFYEVYYYIDMSEKYLRKRDEENGISCLTFAYNLSKRIKYSRSSIINKILLKWANILYYQQKYNDSLAVVSQIQKYENTLQDYMRLYIKVMQALNLIEQLQTFIDKEYSDNLHDNNIKRICVNYYKQTKNWEKLKKLPGYNFKKDQFTQIKASEKMSIYKMLY